MVEPDRGVTTMLRDELLGWGHLSTSAATGTDGLAATLQRSPDLVLLSTGIEDMTPEEFVTALDAIGARTPPVVLMADEPAPPIWQVVGFLHKPLDLVALERVVSAFASEHVVYAP